MDGQPPTRGIDANALCEPRVFLWGGGTRSAQGALAVLLGPRRGAVGGFESAPRVRHVGQDLALGDGCERPIPGSMVGLGYLVGGRTPQCRSRRPLPPPPWRPFRLRRRGRRFRRCRLQRPLVRRCAPRGGYLAAGGRVSDRRQGGGRKRLAAMRRAPPLRGPSGLGERGPRRELSRPRRPCCEPRGRRHRPWAGGRGHCASDATAGPRGATGPKT